MTWQMRAGALLGATSVGAGAYGAHRFPKIIEAEEAAMTKKETTTNDSTSSIEWRKNVWSTAVQYQQLGAMTLMASGVHPSARARMVGGAGILVGTVLFSGANYAVAHSGRRDIGGVAPVGGMSLIAGFVAFVFL